MRVPVGTVKAPKGQIKLRRKGAADSACKEKTQTFAHDVLLLGPRSSVEVDQINGVIQPFSTSTKSNSFTLMRLESPDEKALENSLTTSTAAMTRRRTGGSDVFDKVPLPVSSFVVSLHRPEEVTFTSSTGAVRHFKLVLAPTDGYWDPSLPAWLKGCQKPNMETKIVMSRMLKAGRKSETFVLMSATKEQALLAELAKANSPDPVREKLQRATVFAKHGLLTYTQAEQTALAQMKG